MKYRIIGTDQQTGQDIELAVHAMSDDEAISHAKKKGIVVSQLIKVHEEYEHGSGASPGHVDPGKKVRIPAVCIIILGSLSILFNLIGMCSGFMNASSDYATEPHTPGDLSSQDEALLTIGWTFVAIIVSTFVLWGGIRMLQQKGYALSLAAAIICVIPCLSPLIILGIPFGIWALVVLSNASVKASFS